MAIEVKDIRRRLKDKYAFAFGFLESAVHRAVRELDITHSLPHTCADTYCRPCESVDRARAILQTALRDLEFNHGIELHWPDDVKEKE